MNIAVTVTSQVKFGEHWDKGIEDLAGMALDQLWQNSDYTWKDIDVIFLANCFAERFLGIASLSAHLISRLGLDVPILEVGGGDAAGALAISRAGQMIEGKNYKRVLVLGVEKAADQLSSDMQGALSSLLDSEEIFYGQTLAGVYALIARDYLRLYEATLDDLAEVSFKNHQNSMLNPVAQFQMNLPLGKIKESPIVADPLRILDGASFCDGAAAVILEKADKRKKGVHLIASGYGKDQPALADRRSILEFESTVQAATEAYAMAEIKAGKIDFAEVHDVFTIGEFLAMEDLGLCHRGQAATLLRAGKTRLKGDLPVNPSGGLKACGHALGVTGIRQAIEAVTQLEASAGKRQVKDAEIGLTQTVRGSGSECVVNIFKRV